MKILLVGRIGVSYCQLCVTRLQMREGVWSDSCAGCLKKHCGEFLCGFPVQNEITEELSTLGNSKCMDSPWEWKSRQVFPTSKLNCSRDSDSNRILLDYWYIIASFESRHTKKVISRTFGTIILQEHDLFVLSIILQGESWACSILDQLVDATAKFQFINSCQFSTSKFDCSR